MADVNVPAGLTKNQPIHMAAKDGSLPMLDQLLSMRADIEAKNKDRKRAIHYACEGSQLDVFRFLIDKGADPLTPDLLKCSPFDYATVAPDYGSQANQQLLCLLQEMRVNKTGGGVMQVPQGSMMFEGIVTQVGSCVNNPGTWWWDPDKRCSVEGSRPAGSFHPNLGRA